MMRRIVSAAAGLTTGGVVIYAFTYIGAAVNGLALVLASAAGIVAGESASWAWERQAAAHRAIRDDIARFLVEAEPEAQVQL